MNVHLCHSTAHLYVARDRLQQSFCNSVQECRINDRKWIDECRWINSFDKLKVYNMLKSMVFYCTCIVMLGLLMENNIYFSSIRQVAQSCRFSSTFVSSVPLSLALHTLLIAVFSHILPNKETAGCRVGTRGLIA